MERWGKRFAFILELTAIGFVLILLVELLVSGLGRVTAPQSDRVLNLHVMVAIVLWLGRFSAFGYLGARAAGRAGEWWLAVPAALMAHVGASMAMKAGSLLLAGGGLLMLSPAVLMPDPLEALLVGLIVGTAAAAVGPRLRGASRGERSTPMTAVGAVLVLAVLTLSGMGTTQGLRQDRALRQAMERVSAPSVASTENADLHALLTELLEAQERHRSQGAATFADRPQRAGMAVPAGVDLRVLEAGADGWAARVNRADEPALGCAVWGGRVTRQPTTPGGRPVPQGRVVCDR